LLSAPDVTGADRQAPTPLALEVPESTRPDLTVLVLVSERPEPLAELYREYFPPLEALGGSVEWVFAVEPWLQHLAEEVRQRGNGEVPVQVLVAAQSLGETGLVRMALPHCRAPVLLILSAYRRIDAGALPELVRALDQADLVVARRWPRKDAWVNRLQGRLYHALVTRVSGAPLHDFASGVRAVRREVLEELPLYGDLYRFLPVLAARDGYRVRELDCAQHPRDAGARVYGPGVYLRRALDLLGLYFLLRFTQRPLRFFGLVGSLLSLAGAGMLAVVLAQRLGGQGIADRPLLLLGVLLVVLGVQAIALGLVGEIIVHLHAARQRQYRLARRGNPRE
jgi:hypothetical protein